MNIPDEALEALRTTIGGVLFNVSNFPEKAQVRLLGQDMRPLNDRLTTAIVESWLPTVIERVREEENAKGGTIVQRAADMATRTPFSLQQATEALTYTTDVWRQYQEAQAERAVLRAQLDTIRAIVNDWHVPTFSERHYGSHTAVVKIENALAAYSPTSEETR